MSHDELPHLPDLEDADVIERTLIPALEEWVTDAELGSDQWAGRLTLLVTVHNRIFALNRLEVLDARLGELEAAWRDHDRWAHAEALVLNECRGDP